MRYYLIAGEASGDVHASRCIKEIMKLDAQAEFGFTGGDLMENACHKKADIHINNMAFMGFVDVLKNMGTIRRNFDLVKKAILNFKPDILLLVDYPGFNLRMAKWASPHEIKVAYYISPTVWAWKENRVETIKKYVYRLFVILPFEEKFYLKHHLKVYFVGHPLVDAIEELKPKLKSKEDFISENKLSEKPIIAVLPGSRIQEVERMLSNMAEVTKHFPGYQFVFAGANTVPKQYYESLEQNDINVVFNQTYELMSYASAGVIKSGTSTLESVLFDLPQVVCYKTGSLSFAIGKKLVKIKYISLINLIMDKPVVKELVQHDFTVSNICDELKKLLYDKDYRNNMLSEYQNLKKMLGGTGASKRVAEFVVNDAMKLKMKN